MSIPNYKDIVELLKKGMTIEAQEKIMELRAAAIELQEENLRLREQIQRLESELKQTKNLTFQEEMYWVVDADQKDGPFCAVCHDKDKKLIRLHDGVRFGWKWRCPVCTKGWIEAGRSSTNIQPVRRLGRMGGGLW